MSYTVLARKWRPKNFAELVGQTHVMQALANALDQQRLHHAYLFTGTRGVGKTTIARIFSKALNCQQGISSNPCGQCETCRSIDEGRFIDLIEVDAASKTKVDDTREILDNVQFAPTQGRYKVYLIDEVHMLSKSSFNALLKTLEEPPEHVKFLLATTDPHKLPITVLSRCLQFNLMRLTQTQIQNHLAHILQQEGIAYEDAALALIAKSGDGSARDSLSLLDQAIAYGAGQVMFEAVQTMLGLVDQQFSVGILQALANDDSEGIKQQIQQLATMGVDYQALLSQLIESLHAITYCQVFAESELTTVLPQQIITSLAELLSPEKVQMLYQIALLAKQDMALAPDIRIGFEMSLMRMLAFQPVQAANAVNVNTSNSVETSTATNANIASPVGEAATDSDSMLRTLSTEEAMANLASARSLVGKSAQKKTLNPEESVESSLTEKAIASEISADNQNPILASGNDGSAMQNPSDMGVVNEAQGAFNTSETANLAIESNESVITDDLPDMDVNNRQPQTQPETDIHQLSDSLIASQDALAQNHLQETVQPYAKNPVEHNHTNSVQADDSHSVTETGHSDHLTMIRERLKQGGVTKVKSATASDGSSTTNRPVVQASMAKNDSQFVSEPVSDVVQSDVSSNPMTGGVQFENSPAAYDNTVSGQQNRFADHYAEPTQIPAERASINAVPMNAGESEKPSHISEQLPPWMDSADQAPHQVANETDQNTAAVSADFAGESNNVPSSAEMLAQLASDSVVTESQPSVDLSNLSGNGLQDWMVLIEQLQITGMAAELARNSVLVAIDDQKLQISMDPAQQFAMPEGPLQQIEQAAQKALGAQVKLELVQAEEHFTPAKYAQQQADNRQSQAEQSIAHDPVVQQLKQALNLEVVSGTIRPV